MKIRSTFYDSERMNPIDMIRLDKIKILGCEGHADSSYIETIEVSFNICSKDGFIIGANTGNRFRIVSDIGTGYLPENAIEKQLGRLLESLKIYDIETLLQVLRYRRFYYKLWKSWEVLLQDSQTTFYAAFLPSLIQSPATT